MVFFCSFLLPNFTVYVFIFCALHIWENEHKMCHDCGAGHFLSSLFVKRVFCVRVHLFSTIRPGVPDLLRKPVRPVGCHRSMHRSDAACFALCLQTEPGHRHNCSFGQSVREEKKARLPSVQNQYRGVLA